MTQNHRYPIIYKCCLPKVMLWLFLGGFCLHFILTGRLISTIKLSFLANKTHVLSISGRTITLRNGKTVAVPYVDYIPTNCVLLSAMKGGVSVATNGELGVQLKVHHWCGNDPVVYHVEVVNLSALALTTDPDCADKELARMPWFVEYRSEEKAKNRNRKKMTSVGWPVQNLSTLNYITSKLKEAQPRSYNSSTLMESNGITPSAAAGSTGCIITHQ